MGWSWEVARRQHLALRLERLGLLIEARHAPQATHEEALRANREQRAQLLAELADNATSIPSRALGDAFGLSAFELDVLELAVGMQLDYRLHAPVLAVLPSVREEGLTIGATVALLASSGEVRLDLAHELAGSRLWGAGLLRRPTHEGIDAEVIATRRAIAALLGEAPLERVPPWTRWGHEGCAGALELDPIRTAASVEHGGMLVVCGPTGAGKTELAHAVAAYWRQRFLVVDVVACAEAIGQRQVVPSLVELVEDAAIAGVPLVFDPVRRVLVNTASCERIVDTCESAGVRAIMCVDSVDDLPSHLADRALLRISLRGARGNVATSVYQTYAGEQSAVWLSEDMQLRPRQLRHAAALSRALDIPPAVALQATQAGSADLLQATRTQLRLSDLVVSKDIEAELLELIGAIRGRSAVLGDWGLGTRLSRGRGVSALFDGEPGTGKTMAAEVVAHEVGLPLRRVNIATLVDKYIGETEKNLQRLFLEARSSSYILLFDEADSVFGTRTDVKGSNDRYANLEVNVLLQLMEEHDGIVILTTNLKKNVDQAFLRRLAYKVHFELPDDELRQRIWAGMLPLAQCDRAVDVVKLARSFPLAGGDIKSAVLRASYRAASMRRKITMADLVECAELECQAQGRVVTYRSAL